MTAEIIEFIPEQIGDVPEDKCSFCGVRKNDAFGNFLVHGLNAKICAVCVDNIRKTLTPQPDEPDAA
jgi:hypothetical protein